MSWQDRLREYVTLTAPDGTTFKARWSGNDVTGEKRVGKFNFPLVDGTITQDLGYSSFQYALTLSFEGDNHDVDAWSFTQALAQRGTWAVIHPVYGSKTLQPIGSVTLHADPTNSGNITVIDTTWLEAPITGSTPSAQELGAKIIGQANAVDAAAQAQFLAGTDLADAGAAATTTSVGLSLAAQFRASPIGKSIIGASSLTAQMTTAYNVVVADLQAATLDPTQLAADVQTLVELGATAGVDLPLLVSQFGTFVTSVIGSMLPSGNDSSAKNQVETAELFAVAGLTGIARGISSSTPENRDQCTTTITNLLNLFQSVVDALDGVQNQFQGLLAAFQYFSASATYADLCLLIGIAAQYLLTILFDLRIARTFTLDRPKPPIRICIEEYGSEYDSDGNSNLDLLLLTNGIHGREIILCPAGREITIYEAVA